MDTNSPAGPQFDSTRIPNGARSWAQFLAWVQTRTDTVESDWLEMKSELNLNTPHGVGKVAKFILGAANRDPAVAARAVGGNAIMVLGIKDGKRVGVEPVEDLDLDSKLKPFLGADGPQWDVNRFDGGGDREVILIIVAPPVTGQKPYVCRRDGDGVHNGDFYVRAKGATRKANANDMDMLMARALPEPQMPTLGIKILTPIGSYKHDSKAISTALSELKSNLLWDLPGEVEKRQQAMSRRRTEFEKLGAISGLNIPNRFEGVRGLGLNLGAAQSANLAVFASAARAAQPVSLVNSLAAAKQIKEDRTEDEFREQVDGYISKARDWFDDEPDWFLRQTAKPFRILIKNNSDQYLEGLTVTLHIEGPVEALADDYGNRTTGGRRPPPPRPFGPRVNPVFDGRVAMQNYSQSFSSPSRRTVPPNTATARTTGSVDLTIEVKQLRAQESQTIQGHEVLVVRDPSIRSLHATWEGRAKHLTGVIRGEVDIEVGAPLDVTETMRDALSDD